MTHPYNLTSQIQIFASFFPLLVSFIQVSYRELSQLWNCQSEHTCLFIINELFELSVDSSIDNNLSITNFSQEVKLGNMFRIIESIQHWN